MGIKEYLFILNKKMKSYDKNAKNPFLEYNYAYNPFKSAISQTYVWVERFNNEEQESLRISEGQDCPKDFKNKEKGGDEQ